MSPSFFQQPAYHGSMSEPSLQQSRQTAQLKKSITIASLIMMGSVLVSRIMGMAREMVLAHLLGTNAEMDAYVASFIIPEFLNHFLAGGFLSITFIPIFQKYIFQGDREKAWKVFSNLLTIGSLAFIVLIIISIIFADPLVGLLGHHISEGPRRELTVHLTRIIMPAQLMFYWGAFFMAVQYANHRFFLPALAPLFYNLGIIGCGWALFRLCGVSGFAWGVLVGAFLGNVAIQLPGARKVGMQFRFRFDIKDKDLGKYILVTLPLIVGLGMTFSNEVFFRFFGSFLGTGGLASVSYSLRTMLLLVGVFGQASGVASYPFLTRLANEKNFDEMNRLLNGIVAKIGIYCIPLCAIMMALSSQIIAVLFQHGRFTAASTVATAPVLVMYLIGAFPFAASTIVMRNYYAMQNTLFPMIVSTTIALLSIPSYMVFSKSMGAQGIALAASIMMLVQFTLLYWIWSSRQENRGGFYKTAIMIAKIIGISACGSAGCITIKMLLINLGLPGENFFQNAILSICSGVPALFFIFVILEAGKISNTREIIKRLFARAKA
jgi:putative peptidoglycan lipid II flippase